MSPFRYQIQKPTRENAPYAVLPSLDVVFGFQRNGRLYSISDAKKKPLSPAGVTGLQTQRRIFQFGPKTETILVRMQPWQAASILREPMHRLSGFHPALSDILGQARVRSLLDELQSRPLSQTRSLVAKFLFQRVSLRAPEPPPQIFQAVELLRRSQGNLRIGELAARLPVSRRKLERIFLEYVGIPPKAYASLCRFTAVSHLLAKTKAWEGAMESGYYDQAHFIKDFRRFSSLTPLQYISRKA